MRDWLERFLVRRTQGLTAASRIPVIGPGVRRLGKLLVPAKSIVWVQIEAGAGIGLWMKLNPRTDEVFLHGKGEPSVQKCIDEFLKPGIVFNDPGTNCGYFSLIDARALARRDRSIRLRRNVNLRSELA